MKIALSGRMGNDLPWEREGLTWGRNIYRLTIKWTSSKTALGITSTDSFKCTASQKMHISEYVYKTFLEELTFLCREIIAACDISKTVTLPQVFFFHFLRKIRNEFRCFSKTLSSRPFQRVSLYHSKSCMFLYTKPKM